MPSSPGSRGRWRSGGGGKSMACGAAGPSGPGRRRARAGPGAYRPAPLCGRTRAAQRACASAALPRRTRGGAGANPDRGRRPCRRLCRWRASWWRAMPAGSITPCSSGGCSRPGRSWTRPAPSIVSSPLLSRSPVEPLLARAELAARQGDLISARAGSQASSHACRAQIPALLGWPPCARNSAMPNRPTMRSPRPRRSRPTSPRCAWPGPPARRRWGGSTPLGWRCSRRAPPCPGGSSRCSNWRSSPCAKASSR